ncbi:hypothetical protein [Rubripirellula lacrimiformis]|uniref:hypothetical protein n=1 Tax=Rubripirellula lacrimiformis TaxID=1930273 RepID=UPI0011A5F76D|nr:hypothetical protein [Rubripirellula lacrimiformis]
MRWTSVTCKAAAFIFSWGVGLHLYSLYVDEFQLHNMLFEYSSEGWHWNLFVRLPYLAAIHLALLVCYAMVRQRHGRMHLHPKFKVVCLLGVFAGFFHSQAYDLIRMVLEGVFGLEVSWTPHFAIFWIAYAVATVVLVEAPLFLQKRFHGKLDDADGPMVVPKDAASFSPEATSTAGPHPPRGLGESDRSLACLPKHERGTSP